MPSYRWLWEHRGSLPRNTIQETTSTCRVACGKRSSFYWFLVPGGVRWSTRTSLQFAPLGVGIQRLGASIILDTPFPALNVLLGAHLTFNFEDEENHSHRFKKNGAQWLTSDTLLLCARLCVSAMHKPFNEVDLCSNMKGLHRVKDPATQQVFMWKT